MSLRYFLEGCRPSKTVSQSFIFLRKQRREEEEEEEKEEEDLLNFPFPFPFLFLSYFKCIQLITVKFQGSSRLTESHRYLHRY